MHFRPFRSLSAIALTASLFLGLERSASAANDKEAMKLYDQAMNEDYLNTDFAKAEKKLKEGVKKCNNDNCSAATIGKLHVALGTVFGVGMSKPELAKEEFVTALKADPKAALDESLTNPDLNKIFADAKKIAAKAEKAEPKEEDPPKETPKEKPKKEKPAAASATSSDLTHTPPPEQSVNTPVPIYAEATEEVPVSKVTLRYKPFGAKAYKSLDMKRVGKGYGIEIPCEDVTTTGDIKYFFALTGEDGQPAGTAGSTKEPYKTSVKNEIDGDAPSLPGRKAPEQCKEKADCPPGLPGCPAATTGAGVKRGDKGWGSTCEQTQECQAGMICLNGSCESGKDDSGDGGGGGAAGPAGPGKRNIISLGAQFDLLLIGSKENVCSPAKVGETGTYACFESLSDGYAQFYGPVSSRTGTNGIQGGLGLADVRLMLGYDRQLFQAIPLTAGLRLGFAIGGSPSSAKPPSEAQAKEGYTQALAFLPVHVEARAAYHFLGNGFEHKKIRPYAFFGGGLAQVNASVPVVVCQSGTPGSGEKACKNGDADTKPPSVQKDVEAYQITGLNFIGFGAGAIYGITPNFGVQLELKMMVMLPTTGFVIAPSLGPVLGF